MSQRSYITRKRIYYRPGFVVYVCPSEGGGTIAPDCAPSSIFDTSRVKRNTDRRIHTPRYTIDDPFLLFLFYPQLFSLSLSLFLWISSTNFFSGNIARKYTSFSYKNKLSAKHSLFQRIVTTIGENRSLKSVAWKGVECEEFVKRNLLESIPY